MHVVCPRDACSVTCMRVRTHSLYHVGVTLSTRIDNVSHSMDMIHCVMWITRINVIMRRVYIPWRIFVFTYYKGLWYIYYGNMEFTVWCTKHTLHHLLYVLLIYMLLYQPYNQHVFHWKPIRKTGDIVRFLVHGRTMQRVDIIPPCTRKNARIMVVMRALYHVWYVLPTCVVTIVVCCTCCPIPFHMRQCVAQTIDVVRASTFCRRLHVCGSDDMMRLLGAYVGPTRSTIVRCVRHPRFWYVSALPQYPCAAPPTRPYRFWLRVQNRRIVCVSRDTIAESRPRVWLMHVRRILRRAIFPFCCPCLHPVLCVCGQHVSYMIFDC